MKPIETGDGESGVSEGSSLDNENDLAGNLSIIDECLHDQVLCEYIEAKAFFG